MSLFLVRRCLAALLLVFVVTSSAVILAQLAPGDFADKSLSPDNEPPSDLLEDMRRIFRSTEINVLYGPTEATIDASYHRYDGNADAERGSVPIGRPVANMELYLLDDELEPVPIGVPGEIYIGGTGLARGYLQRAGLTAEKFIPDPFSGRAGARLYRTGDQGRYLEDGNIEYRGRLDQQVKLRGYRIELGEIEAVIKQQPGVSEAAVVVREDSRGEKWLMAYVMSEKPGAEPEGRAGLRR